MKFIPAFVSSHRVLAPLLSMSVLAACGGGGGSDPAPAAGGGTSLAVSGTAATGAAIVAGAVQMKCANGSTGSGTTAADGSFSITLDAGQAPCLLRVTAANGQLLHSLVIGSGRVVANITPITEMIVAALGAGGPAALFDGFAAGGSDVVNTSTVAAASARILAKLKAAGIDLTALANPLTGPLLIGDAADRALEALKTRLTANGITLAQWVAALLTEIQAINDPGATSGAVSLPAELRLQAAASNCAALRSGRYRVVMMKGPGLTPADMTGFFDLNASTLGFVNDDGSSSSLTATGPCQYTEAPDKALDISVTQAGIIVFRSVENGGARLGIAFPEQSHTVAELAGSWNTLGFTRNGNNTGYAADAAGITLDAGGTVTALSYCAGVIACAPVPGVSAGIVSAGAGAFRLTSAAAASDRAFAYRAGGGDLLFVTIGDDSSFSVWTRSRNFVFPTVTGTLNTSWDYELNDQQVASAFSTSTNTIVSVDTAAGSFVRETSTTTAGVTRTETLFGNNPRAGYRHRPAGPVPTNGGTPTPREQVILQLRGMGLTPVAYPTANAFGLSVTPPPAP